MTTPSFTTDRFSQPAVNDADGFCTHCGRDNIGHEGEPCADECPMYWEAVGIAHPSYAVAA